MNRTITAVSRPYVITFKATGQSYPLTSADAQNAIDNYPAITATANRVVLQGHNTSDPEQRTIIQPATRGGGPAFIITNAAAAEPAVIVIFRTYKAGDVIALFPTLPGSVGKDDCTCYQRLGQHGAADYRTVISQTRPATETETAPLRDELIRIGYRLNERRRYTQPSARPQETTR